MAEAVGNEVLELRRVRLGGLELGDLGLGESRQLAPEEIERLWEDSRP